MLRKMSTRVFAFVSMMLAAVMCSFGSAFASSPTFTITTPTFDYAQIATYVGVILAALGVIWLVRKFIKITNRS